MKYLFDREQMQQVDRARLRAWSANDQPIDPTNRFYFAGLPQRPFDPDKAKFHLQKAGIGSAASAGGGVAGRDCTRSRWRWCCSRRRSRSA